MGKDGGFMTAKAISKRIKSKGLGRLRWYCQMCEKQCRDENGFKCHTQSAGHQRQLTLFAENSPEYITRFSNEFRKEFLSVLRQRFSTKFVSSNTVYQEHIKDRDHVHMNATRWTTLSGFVKELGKQGYCRVEERGDGFWVAFVDREAAERDRKAREMDRQRIEEEERSEKMLQKQIAAASKIAQSKPPMHMDASFAAPTSGPVSIKAKAIDQPELDGELAGNALEALGEVQDDSANGSEAQHTVKKRKRKSRWQDAPKSSVLDEIMRAEKEKALETSVEQNQGLPSVNGSEDVSKVKQDDDAWLCENIVVKIRNETLAEGKFYGKKGKVVEVVGGYGARVSVHESTAVLELDQDDLETVIPKPGGKVLILRGAHRGSQAVVLSIDVDAYAVNLILTSTEEELQNIEYEAISRLA